MTGDQPEIIRPLPEGSRVGTVPSLGGSGFRTTSAAVAALTLGHPFVEYDRRNSLRPAPGTNWRKLRLGANDRECNGYISLRCIDARDVR